MEALWRMRGERVWGEGVGRVCVRERGGHGEDIMGCLAAQSSTIIHRSFIF